MKISKFRENLYLIIVFILIGIMSFLTFVTTQNIFLNAIESILTILFISFLPGYVLTYLIFRNELSRSEILLLSIGLSVCVTVLMGMMVHFIRIKINFFNIMQGVLIVSLIFVILAFFKKSAFSSRLKRLKIYKSDKLFFFCLLLLLFVISLVVYFSITFPSKEEFVELYWKVSELKDLKDSSNINCNLANCSLSGVYKVGNVGLLNNSYEAITTDLNEKDVYDAICIDFNQNEVFCEKGEGPFKTGDSFMVNSRPFNVMNSKNNNVYIANYPKNINVSNFTVGFVIKSDYNEVKNFNVGLFVNETLQKSENLRVEQHQEITNYYTIHLPEDGLYRVRVAILPLTLEDRTYIEFWVEKGTQSMKA